MASKVSTKIIDNFSGEITSDQIGSLNSGLCPIGLGQSGKLPTANPYITKGLQFIEAPYSVNLNGNTFSAPIVQSLRLIVGGAALPGTFGVALDGSVYMIAASNLSTTPDLDQLVKFTYSVGDTLHYGGGFFYDAFNKFALVGTDSGLYISTTNPLPNPTTTQWTAITSGGVSWLSGYPRPVAQFLGYIFVANGNQLVQLQWNGSTYTVVSTSILNPTLPTGYAIRNIQVSADGTYLTLTASMRQVSNDFDISSGQQPQYQPLDSVVVYWNGIDITYSSLQFFKGLNIVSLATSATDTIMFAKDMHGTGIFSLSGARLATLEDVTLNTASYASYPPSIFSVDIIGKMFYFLCQIGTTVNICEYDSELGKLYILTADFLSQTGSIMGGVSAVTLHANAIVSGAWTEVTRAKLYVFYKNLQLNTSMGYVLHLQNYGGNLGQWNYQTQFEEFSQKVKPVEVRVFTTPTKSGDGIQVRLQDLGLNTIMSKLYTYAAGTDITKAQGSLNCIRFGISGKETSSISLSLQPGGNTCPVIEKVEIDYIPVANPSSN